MKIFNLLKKKIRQSLSAVNFSFKSWEKVIITISVLLFAISFTIYLTDFPIRKYIFGMTEDNGQTVVGQVHAKSGNLRRQLSGQMEFEPLPSDANLYNMDTVVTGPDSDAKLKFENDGSVELGENTMVRLAFQPSLAVGNISRKSDSRLDVVSGKVTGKAGKQKLVIKSQDKVITLTPHTETTMRVKIKPAHPSSQTSSSSETVIDKPTPSLPEQATPKKPIELHTVEHTSRDIPEPPRELTPKPKKSKPHAEHSERLTLISPQPGEIFSVENFSKNAEKSVHFAWELGPPLTHSRLTVWKIEKGSSKDNKRRTQIHQSMMHAEDGKTKAGLTIKTPGSFEWEVTGPKGEILLTPGSSHSSFKVASSFRGIRVLTPLVEGNPISNPNVTLRWSKYPGASNYHIWIGKTSSSSSTIFEKEVNQPQFTFNRSKLLINKLYYQISAELDNGFVVSSNMEKFGTPSAQPSLVKPPNNMLITPAILKKENFQIVMSWPMTKSADTYEIEIAKDPDFKQPYLKKTLTENFFILPEPPQTKYWWRVRSMSGNSEIQIGKVYSFTVTN